MVFDYIPFIPNRFFLFDVKFQQPIALLTIRLHKRKILYKKYHHHHAPSLNTTTDTKQTKEIPKHSSKPYSSGIKFRAHTAASVVFLPQKKLHLPTNSIASSGAHKLANQNRNIALSLLLTAPTGNMNIYLIDLNAPDVGLPPKSSLNDVLHYYCKKIRAQKKSAKENYFILFLTNNRLNSVLNAYKSHVSPHKKNHLFENMTVMHYNIDTAILNTFLQKPQA